MALKASTGLRNKLLDTNPLKTIFNLGFLNIYSGPVPSSADDAMVGGTHTLLCQISNNNTTTGITFASTASGGAITKNAGETWSKAAVATGTAAFYRLITASDTGVSSTTEARVQGVCATSGGDLNLTSLSLTSTTVYTIDSYSVSIPTL
jgi:hypothetical protein